MKLSLDLDTIKSKLAPILHRLQQYMVLIFILGFLGIYGFLIFRINILAGSEPSDEAVAEKLNTVQRPRVDQQAVDKIDQLQAQNIEVQTLFNQARSNPFVEEP
jgi:hypothetical protein